MILNNKLINLEFKDLKEVSDNLSANRYISFNSKENISVIDDIRNDIEMFSGLHITTLSPNFGDENFNAIIYPGRCLVSKVGKKESKLHFNHHQVLLEYKIENFLDDGSQLITIGSQSNWLYLYAVYNESNSNIIFKFSHIPPSRDRYNREILMAGEITMYHPSIDARCIGTFGVGNYGYGTSYPSAGFKNMSIQNNILMFHENIVVYIGSYDSWYNFSNYENPPTKIGGFPITANGCLMTLANTTECSNLSSPIFENDNIVNPDYSYLNKINVTSVNSSLHKSYDFHTAKDLRFRKQGAFNAYVFIQYMKISR